jgi:hypothetical protein
MRETASGSGACVLLVNPFIRHDPKLKIVVGRDLFLLYFKPSP